MDLNTAWHTYQEEVLGADSDVDTFTYAKSDYAAGARAMLNIVNETRMHRPGLNYNTLVDELESMLTLFEATIPKLPDDDEVQSQEESAE